MDATQTNARPVRGKTIASTVSLPWEQALSLLVSILFSFP